MNRYTGYYAGVQSLCMRLSPVNQAASRRILISFTGNRNWVQAGEAVRAVNRAAGGVKRKVVNLDFMKFKSVLFTRNQKKGEVGNEGK